MLKVLAVCGNGMGTSMIMKMKVQKILKKLNVLGQVDYCSLEQAALMIDNFDVILASAHVAQRLVADKAKIISLLNLLDEKELEPKLLEALKK